MAMFIRLKLALQWAEYTTPCTGATRKTKPPLPLRTPKELQQNTAENTKKKILLYLTKIT
jgi:hypothetical protein